MVDLLSNATDIDLPIEAFQAVFHETGLQTWPQYLIVFGSIVTAVNLLHTATH